MSAAALDIPVEFGNVSIGDATARIGVRFPVGSVKQSDVTKKLCEKRIDALITTNDDQQRIPGTEDEILELTGMADTRGVNVKVKTYSTGLTFSREDVDLNMLSNFAKKKGRLVVNDSESIPEKPRGRPKKDDSPKPLKGQRQLPGTEDNSGPDPDDSTSVLDASLTTLKSVTLARATAIEDAIDVVTLGEFKEFVEANPETWRAKLLEAERVGKSLVKKIESEFRDWCSKHGI